MPDAPLPQRETERRRGLFTPRRIAGASLLLSVIAVSVAIVALALALDEAEVETVVVAPEDYPAARTVEMVDDAIRFYEANGWERTAEFYLSPWSVDGVWSLFIVSPEGRIAVSQDASLVGEDIGALGRDYRGTKWGDIVIPEGGRWVNSQTWHPVTGWPTIKRTWVMRHDGYVFGSAWYE